jgi:uncharacterized protein
MPAAHLLDANALIAHPQHRLAALDFGFEQVLATCTAGLQGHRQIPDAWLLTCAIRHGMKLLTLDTGLPMLLATQDERAAQITVLRCGFSAASFMRHV